MNQRALSFIIIIFLALVWGSAFILMKRGLEAFSPFQVASLRLVIAGLFLSPYVIIKLKELPKSSIKYFLLVGIIGNGIPAFLFTVAQTKLSSSIAGALNSLTPLFTLIISVLIFKNQPGLFRIFGVIMGLAGALILIFFKENSSFNTDSEYGMLLILATLFYGISVNTIREKLKAFSPILIGSVPLFFISIPAMGILFNTEFLEVLNSHPKAWSSFGYICILAIVGTSISVIIFSKLIQMTSAVFASSTTYLVPVVALAWGFLDGETISFAQWIGMIGILAGIYLINKKTAEKKI